MGNGPRVRLLFVDDEPQVLRLLQLAFRAMSEQWEMAFVGSGEQALELMAAQGPFDIVVSDMRMPGMSGAQLLNEVMKRTPQTARIILSGYADQDQVLRCVGAVHQYFAKPFEPLAFRTALLRVCALSQRLQNAQLQALVAGIRSVPSIPDLFVEMVEALEAPDCPAERIGRIVAKDPGLTAKVLQLVNSAFFGYAHQVVSAPEAVQVLGVSLIRALALGVRLFSAFDGSRARAFSVGTLWRHSLRTALLARRIMEVEGGDECLKEQAFTAGLLHDTGKLALAAELAEPYLRALKRARTQRWPVFRAELEAFGSTHAEVGAYLLGLWGLPTPLVEAVAFHHQPATSADTAFSPLTAVHVADVLTQEKGRFSGEGAPNQLDAAHLEQLGATDRLPLWEQAAKEAGTGASDGL